MFKTKKKQPEALPEEKIQLDSLVGRTDWKWNRQRLKVWFTNRDGDGYPTKKIRHEKEVEYTDPEANLITSQIEGTELHAPVLDFDFPCELRPSSTAGHFHLLINKPMTWEQYEVVLKALQFAGLLEKGWVGSAIINKKSMVRAEGVLKYEIEVYGKSLSALVDSLTKSV